MAHRLMRACAAPLVLFLLVAALPAAARSAEAAGCLDPRQSLNSLLDDLLRTSRDSGFPSAQPELAAKLQDAAQRIALSGAGALTVEQVAGLYVGIDLKYGDYLRWNADRFAAPGVAGLTTEELNGLITEVKRAVNRRGTGLKDHLDAVWGEARREEAMCGFNAFYDLQLDASIAGSFDKLERYERKFGPRAPRLNAVEALLNLAVAPVPGFGADPQNGPGAWEIVAAYSTSYVGLRDGEARVTSLLEMGLRRYLFGSGWGGGGLAGLLKPGYCGAGAVVAGAPDGALIGPFRGDERWGVFATWGSVKVAYLYGENADRWLISKQFQFVPALF